MPTLSSEILRELRDIKRLLMTLSAGEQQVVNTLATAVSKMATDLQTILDQAKERDAVNTARIDELSTQGRMDSQTIGELRAMVSSQDTDVAAALQPIIDQLTGIDDNLHDPETPLTPTGDGTETPPADGDQTPPPQGVRASTPAPKKP